MVSMAVSTVSVIESIVVIRLCTLNDNATPLPPVVRLIAFRVVGRALCVSCPSTKVRPTGQCRSSRRPSAYNGDQYSKDRRLSLEDDVTSSSSEAVKRRAAVDDILAELRKVTG